MKTFRNPNNKTLFAAAALLMLMPMGAIAEEVTASGGGALYTGPSLDFHEVGWMTNGKNYIVTRCLSDISWCEIIGDGGQVGWAPASYLIGSGAKLDAREWGLTQADFWNPER